MQQQGEFQVNEVRNRHALEKTKLVSELNFSTETLLNEIRDNVRQRALKMNDI